jgi:hypothetical protein
MIRFPRRWNAITCINYLQRKIILNSIAYYKYDKSFVSDSYFDEMSHQLVQMQKDFAGNLEADTEYGYMMYDFDGSTGFDLPDRLFPHDKDYLTQMTEYYICRQEKSKPVKKITKTVRRKLF